jgi:DNA-binding transcriptional MocR family regulator
MPDRTTTRYRALARDLAGRIESGAYAAGERLPSVRRLRETHGVSAATAERALIELEQGGWAEARPRSGFYVRPRPERSPSAPVATRTAAPAPASVNRLIERLFRAASGAGRPLTPLGAAELDETLLPHKALAAAAARAAREGGAGLLAYGPPSGDPLLRRRLAQLMERRGVAAGPDDLFVTAGSGDALGLALMALTKPGDLVAVESPCFYGFLQWIETLGLRAVEIATDPVTGLDLDELERALDAHPIAVLALNPVFHNPFGGAMPVERMRRLTALAAARRLPVIEDDVYGELSHDGHPARPLKSADAEGWVIHCASFSKTLAPGFRLGWCLPGRFAEALARVRAPRPAGVSTLAQRAVALYLDGRAYSRHVEGLARLFAAQAGEVRRLVLDAFPEGTRISEPKGGFVFWVEVPPPFDALAFHETALAAGITVAPGPIFSASGGFTNAFRLAVGTRLSPAVARAIAELGGIARHAGQAP